MAGVGDLAVAPLMGAHHEERLRRLPILTNSSLTTFRRCPREYQFRYISLRKLVFKAAALKFGSLFHVGLNAWWAVNSGSVERLGRALLAIRAYAQANDTDSFEVMKAETLMAGYTARWGDAGYETIAVEKRFFIPGEVGSLPSFVMAGSIDAIASLRRGQSLHNIEHKTTGADISVASDYWRQVMTMDNQVSTYHAAAKALGYDVRDTVYDVIRKPEIVPLKATPEEDRTYTIPTKKNPVPRLYAKQREEDETPEQYGERLAASIAEKPDWYFARTTIVRLERDDAEHACDTAHTARLIAFCTEEDMWPRSPNACERYHRLCDYHPVCSGETTIESSRYENKTEQHEELVTR